MSMKKHRLENGDYPHYDHGHHNPAGECEYINLNSLVFYSPIAQQALFSI
jgi:hypothetical protein